MPSLAETGAPLHRPKVLVLHGPNLNFLGTREPELYGQQTLAELNTAMLALAATLRVDLEIHQTNHEGDYIEFVHRLRDGYAAAIINPGAYSHTSVAILDAIRCVRVPVIEVHLSNIHAREAYRERSLTASGCVGVITGFGVDSYFLALRYAAQRVLGPTDKGNETRNKASSATYMEPA